MDKSDALGATITAIVLIIVLGVLAATNRTDDASAKCQSLGFSAGHYDREYGLVCEQWTPAVKVRP